MPVLGSFSQWAISTDPRADIRAKVPAMQY